MSTHLTKIWWDLHKHQLMAESIPESEIYKPQKPQKPVAWMHVDEYKTYFTTCPSEDLVSNGYWTPLYTTPKPEQQEPVALETVYETIVQWDEGGGKRSRRELARRITALYTAAHGVEVKP